jgi:hypothetical protein
MMQIVAAEWATPGLIFMHLGYSVGCVVGPLVLSLVTVILPVGSALSPYSTTYAIAGGLQFTTAILFLICPKLRSRKPKQKVVEEYYQSSSYQSSSEYSIQSPDDIIQSHDEMVIKKVEIIPTPLVSISATILCSIAYAISSASDTCTGDYMLTYVVSTKLSSEQNARFLHSAFYLSVCFGKLITIPLSKVLSPWKIILAYSVLAVGSVVVALMFYNQFILFGIGMILFGLFLSAQSPIIIGLPTTYVGMPVKGSVTSSILTTGKVGSTLVPLTVPFAIDVIGPTALLWTLLVLGTVAVVDYISIVIFYRKNYIANTNN